jgi:hypothetical protein
MVNEIFFASQFYKRFIKIALTLMLQRDVDKAKSTLLSLLVRVQT